MHRSLRAAPLLVLAAACTTTTSPVCRPEPYRGDPAIARGELLPPLARPQVMIDAPRANGPSQVVVASMTEEQRTEALRAAGSPIQSYTPLPFHLREPSTCETGLVEQRIVDGYDGAYRTYAPAPYRSYSPGWSLARTAAYTGMGAIIGHQFHDQGAGAAIGAGVALLTTPFWGLGGWGGDGCWDW